MTQQALALDHSRRESYEDTRLHDSISTALDHCVNDHAEDLLELDRFELTCWVEETETPPQQAGYQLQGTLCGRWTIGLGLVSRSGHLPAGTCHECEGTGMGPEQDYPHDCEPCGDCRDCDGTGRSRTSHVRLTVVYEIDIEQPRNGKSKRVPSSLDWVKEDNRRTAADAIGFNRVETLHALELPESERASSGAAVLRHLEPTWEACWHASHRDPRAGHLGRCPKCGEVLDNALGAPSVVNGALTDARRELASANPDPSLIPTALLAVQPDANTPAVGLPDSTGDLDSAGDASTDFDPFGPDPF